MKNRNFILLVYTAILLAVFGLPSFVSAKSDILNQAMEQVKTAAEPAELANPIAPQAVITDIIRRVLTLTGALFMILMVYGGYIYVTARGEDEEIQKGTKIIQAAIIGIVIVLLSYSITMFVGSRAVPLVTEGEEVEK